MIVCAGGGIVGILLFGVIVYQYAAWSKTSQENKILKQQIKHQNTEIAHSLGNTVSMKSPTPPMSVTHASGNRIPSPPKAFNEARQQFMNSKDQGVMDKFPAKIVNYTDFQTKGALQVGDTAYYQHGKAQLLCKILAIKADDITTTTHKIIFIGPNKKLMSMETAWVKPNLLIPAVIISIF